MPAGQNSLKRRWIRAAQAAFRGACWLSFVFGAACAVYLTLRRSSELRTVWWIPYPLARWADYHGRTRNLVAYWLLATPILVLNRDRSRQLKWLVALGIFGTALEYGQLWIPTRWFEWQDIALTLAGLLASWVMVEGARWAFRGKQPIRPAVRSKPR
ncbi:MAG TPA: hypothetical protein VGF85_04520 [Opitutaceae bacterium]|jgi:hypothetical protein